MAQLLPLVLTAGVLYAQLQPGMSEGSCTKPIPLSIRLRDAIFCNYDKKMRPAKDKTTATNVFIYLSIAAMDMDEKSNILYLYTWTSWIWNDEHLTWDPSSYENLNVIRVDSDSIWVPDVRLTTSREQTAPLRSTCLLKADGTVSCVSQTLLPALCYSDVELWPFDKQTCTAEMGSLTYFGSQINLTLPDKGIFTRGMQRNREWELANTSATVQIDHFGNDTYPTLKLTFTLRRHPGGHAATVVVPAFVLSLLTLLTFWLQPAGPERLMLGCMNVLAHCLYLQYLGYALPHNGDQTPRILIFFRDSLFLVGASLAVAVAARALAAARAPPPSWLAAAAARLLASRPGQLLLLARLSPQAAAAAAAGAAPGEDGGTLMGAAAREEAEGAWQHAATLLNRVAFLTFCIAFFSLLAGYVP